MAKASDNQFPSVLLAEQGSAPAGPAAGHQRIFIDSSDHRLKRVDESDAVVDLEASSSVDAGDVTYTPAVAADWDGDADPGDVDQALDQLAERVDDLEAQSIGALGIAIDGGGSAIATGPIKTYLEVPYNCTLTGWTLLADQNGAIKIDVWKNSYANYPPTNADSICNGHEPEIAAELSAQDTDLSDWLDVTLTKGEILVFNVDSCSSITACTLAFQAVKS